MRKTIQSYKLYLYTGLSNYKRYLSNLGASFFSQAITALSILLLTPVLLRSLGEQAFGIYGILLNIIALSAVFDFGLNIGLLRKLIHEKDRAVAVVNAVFFFYILLSILAVPAFYFLYRFDFLKSDGQYLLTGIFTALIVGQNMIAVFFDVMIQSANKIFVGKMVRVIKTVVEFFVLYLLSSTGSIKWVLAGSAAVNFLYLLILSKYAQKEVRYQLSPSLFNWRVLAEHIRYSFWYFQTTLSSVLVYNAQIIVIGSMVAPASVSRYYMVMRFFDVIRSGMGNFTLILFPSLSMLQASADWARLQQMFLRVLLRVSIMVGIAVLGILTIGEYLFVYWSKYNDTETLQLFRWYAILIALLLIEHVPVVFLAAFKFNKLPAIVGTVQGLLGLMLTWFLVPEWGIAGAVIASVIALLATNFLFNPIYLFTKMKTYVNGTEPG